MKLYEQIGEVFEKQKSFKYSVCLVNCCPSSLRQPSPASWYNSSMKRRVHSSMVHIDGT